MLRKRMTINNNNITLWRAVLVGNDGEIEGSYGGKHLMDLKEEIIHKHLKIIGELMNRKVNDKLIDVEIKQECRGADLFQAMRTIMEEPEENTPIIDLVLAEITGAYCAHGKYMLFMYLDIYDIPSTAADGTELEDGDVVYKNLIFAICPVTKDREGLAILPDARGGTEIQEKIRQWIIGPPRIGFVYPAFRDAAPDHKSIMYYTAKPDEPKHWFMEDALNGIPKMTATEKRQTFEKSVRSIEDNAEVYLERLNEILYSMDGTNAILTPGKLYEYLMQCGAEVDEAGAIRDIFDKGFRRYQYPEIKFLVNEKLLKNLDARRHREEIKKVMTMSAAKLAEYGEHSMVEELRAEVKKIV